MQDRQAVRQPRVEFRDYGGERGAQAVYRGRAEAVPPALLDLGGHAVPHVARPLAAGGQAHDRVRAGALAAARVWRVGDVAPAAHAVQVRAGPRRRAHARHGDPVVRDVPQAVRPHHQRGLPWRVGRRARRQAVVLGAVRQAVLGLVVGFDREGDQRLGQQCGQREPPRHRGRRRNRRGGGGRAVRRPGPFWMRGRGGGAGQQQARGPQPVAAFLRDLPAGAGQQLAGRRRRQRAAHRLAHRRHRRPEPLAVGGPRVLRRHADRQRAAGHRHRAELPQHPLEHRLLQVDGHAFEQEQRRAAGVQARRGQQVRHRVRREVGGDERDVAGVEAEPGDPGQLVGLRRGVVDLEPAHARFRVPERPAVIPGGAHDHLPDPAVEGVDHHPVEERGPGAEVLVPRAARPAHQAVGHVAGQRLVRGGIAVRRLEPLVAEPVRGHAAGGLGRRVVSHALILPE